MKSKILVKETATRRPVKMIFNRYRDCFFVIITQRDKFGSFIEVLREDEDFDVKLLSGASSRGDKYLDIAHTLTKIWIGNPREVLGLETKKEIDLFKSRTNKKILFNICLDIKPVSDDTINGIDAGFEDELEEEMRKELFIGWKEFVIENINFF